MADERTLTLLRGARRWAFALVPVVGLVELGAHLVQARSAPARADWEAARAYVASQAKPEDLIAFAPRWTDPVGREVFGAELATLEREAPPDDTRFPRAFEVSIRGARLPELQDWKSTAEQRFGGVTVETLENPAPAHVITDLVARVNATDLHVSRGDQECTFGRAAPQSGGLGFGPGVPAERFTCPGNGLVAVSVVADLDYRPHRCIYAPPPVGAPIRLRFPGVAFGAALHGHHGLYVEAERSRKGAPVTLAFKAGGADLGSVVHHDGDGWKPFEFDTSALAGQRADLVVEVSSPNADRRTYCFEADTR